MCYPAHCLSQTSPFDLHWKTSGASELGVPKNLMKALCMVESNLNHKVVVNDTNGHKSLGICQIQLRTAKEMGYEGNWRTLMLPSFNIYYAAKYLKYQYKRYGYEWTRAIGAYNQGYWSKENPNKKYLDKVIKSYFQLVEQEGIL